MSLTPPLVRQAQARRAPRHPQTGSSRSASSVLPRLKAQCFRALHRRSEAEESGPRRTARTAVAVQHLGREFYLNVNACVRVAPPKFEGGDRVSRSAVRKLSEREHVRLTESV